MEQVLDIVRGTVGDSSADLGEPREEKQHDREPPADRHRRVQVLRGEAHLLRARLLVPVHTRH